MAKLIFFYLLLVLPLWANAQIKEKISYLDSITTNKYKGNTYFYSNGKGFTYQDIKTYKKDGTTNTITIWGESANIDSDSVHCVYYKSNVLLIIKAITGDSFEYSESITKGNKVLKYYSHQIDRWSIKLPFLEAKDWLKSIW